MHDNALRTATSLRDLKERIAERRFTVGILGLGYVGLPLAVTFTGARFPVMGFDLDAAKVEALNQGRSYIRHIPAKLISEAVGTERFSATSDFARLGEPDAVLLCVPTPLNRHRDPDMTYVEASARAVAAQLRPGQLIVLESTTYPGTCDDVVRPILEETGLRSGTDFYLAYSPEREDPGNPDFDTRSIPAATAPTRWRWRTPCTPRSCRRPCRCATCAPPRRSS